MSTRFRARSFRTMTATAAASVLAMAGLAACGNDSTTDAADDTATGTETAPHSAAPPHANRDAPLPDGITPAMLILDGTSTPEGFTHIPPNYENQADLANLLNDPNDPTPPLAVEPPNCAGLAVDGTSILTWMSEPPETTALAGFTRDGDEDDGIFIMVTNTPADPAAFPASISDCASFKSTLTNSMGTIEKNFDASDEPLSAEGADILVAAKVKVVTQTLDGQPMGPTDPEVFSYTLTATVRGVTFTVLSDGSLPAEQVSSLATAQAQRILDA